MREDDFKEIRNSSFFCSPRSCFAGRRSDHAYLPIELVEKGHIEAAIAGEVVEGPYQSAVRNVESHSLTEKIHGSFSNGLAAFEVSDQVSVITIAGMGGRFDCYDIRRGFGQTSQC